MAKKIGNSVLKEKPNKEKVKTFNKNLEVALSKWQKVELALQKIALLTMGAKTPDAFMAGYGSIRYPEFQVDFIDAAIRCRCLDSDPEALELRRRWIEKRLRLINKMRQRNLLL